MSSWAAANARTIAAAEAVAVLTQGRDRSLRRPVTIWVVTVGDRVFVRSTNGRGASWFRGATATGEGQLRVRGTSYDVAFAEADQADLRAVDAAYRTTYRRYASIVEHLLGPGPREATLEVQPV